MTNEQREVIDRLEKLVRLRKSKSGVIKYDNCICSTLDLDLVLSLIKEQQEEIEGLKDKEVLIKRYFNKCDLIKQKDKQIDLMANSILAREIGKNSCQFNKTCTKFEKGRDIHCKDCIKQYFENKVNSEKEK